MSVVEGRTLTADLDRGCDVCIVGSGAGGSVLAAGLCARGLDVVMVEEGPYRTAKDFDLEERHAYTEMYQDRGLRTSEDGAVIVLQGRTVGGGTTVNWTTCFRTPDETLAHWRDHHGLDELTPDALRPHFDAVEARLGIGPWPEQLVNANNQVLLRGARKLGYEVAPLRRNVRGCINSGYCGVGCAWDAKQSMINTYLPDAFADGLTLFSDMRADRIEMHHDRAGLVLCSALDGRKRTGVRLRIRPRIVVVAGGAINTPALLLRSELELHAKIGHRTFIHPTVAVTGRYREAIDGWSGAPQSVGSHHFFRRGEEVGYFLECPPLQPVLASSALSAFGADQLVYMQNLRHVSGLIALMVDGWHEDVPGGVVRLASDGRPRVNYAFSPRIVRAMKEATTTLARIHLAAGAATVITLHGKSVQVSSESDLQRLEFAPYGPHEHVIFTAHQMGGAAMGADPLRHPVDPHHRLRDTQNVFVVDGSVFPTAVGVNPSETIYALAHRAVDYVAAAV